MGIRKLKKDIQGDTEFFLKENQGIIVFDINSELLCLYLDSPNKEDLLKLDQFEDFSSYKYIGDESLYHSITESYEKWPVPVRAVFTQNEQKVVYCSISGKVKFEKVKKDKIQEDKVQEIKEQSKKNVLIIDDSPTIQKLLAKIINDSEQLNLVGVASKPSEAKTIIESEERIDLITLDIHMPEMNGVEFLKTYLSQKNIPTIMISSVSINEGPLVMEALSSGAATYIQKPSLDKLSEVKDDIVKKLEAISTNPQNDYKFLSINKTVSKFSHFNGLIAIGSSTGGTQALQELFTSLPSEIPPIVVVQHIPAVFSAALAERLNQLCDFEVKEAVDGEFLKKDTVYIAPGGKQMKLLKRGQEKRVQINDDPPVNRFQPSVDYLFETIPALEEENLIGVILTGMGRDGAKGLLGLKEAGAITIAQDEKTSVVFGMPKEAIAIGAASKVIALDDMAKTFVEEFNKLINKEAA